MGQAAPVAYRGFNLSLRDCIVLRKYVYARACYMIADSVSHVLRREPGKNEVKK